MKFMNNPSEIEQKSFEIITDYLGDRHFDPYNIDVIKRCIHTTADFDYADNLVFSDGASVIAKSLLQGGANIVTDTQMVRAGINKKTAKQLGCEIHCFIDDNEVTEIAKKSGFTRAREAVDHASRILQNPVIFVVGNAPTALIRLYELITSQVFSPAFIIAVPVGFVNVIESKELILGLQIPHIVAKGRKGGSNVAAAICNALMYGITSR